MEKNNLHANCWIGYLIADALRRGARVDVDGLGEFLPTPNSGYTFKSRGLPKVFVTYVHEDAIQAERLFDRLAEEGFEPWLDRRKLLPGQNWPRAISDAIEVSDFVVACFSSRSVSKRGGFQAEVRQALECARLTPLDEVFLVPVRLDDCGVPNRIQRETQFVDLFPDWEQGFKRITRMLKAQWRSRLKAERLHKPQE